MGNIQGHPLTLNILEFTSIKERSQLAYISRDYRHLALEIYVQKWMCYRLMEDYKLYHSLKLSSGTSWQKIYRELRGRIDLWNCKEMRQTGSNQSKIQVYSRFRPFDKLSTINSLKESEQRVITLPLHQRLTLIKLTFGLKSNKQALRVLKEEGSWFGKKWNNIDLKKSEIEEDKENMIENSVSLKKSGNMNFGKSAPLTADIQSVDPSTGRVVIVAPDVGMREFSFDGVFPGNSSQTQVYDSVASGLVTDVMNGCNATAIMYGQTGSGEQ